MRKFINIFLAVLITLFSFPINSLNVSAEGKAYDDIKDGEYELTAKFLKKGTDEESAAAGFMEDDVTLEVNDGNYALTFYIPDNDMMNFNDFVLEEVDPKINDDSDPMEYTFTLKELKENLSSKVAYEVPAMNLVHNDVGMDIELVGLDDLPKVEEEEEEPTPENPDEDSGSDEEGKEDGKDESEDETTEVEPLADGAYELSYTTEGANLGSYYEDKVIVIVDGDKQYLQLQGKSMRQFIEYLYIDGERMDVSAATNEQGAYMAQIELDEKVEENKTLVFNMIINAAGRIMAHGTEMTLDLSTAENLDSAELIEGVPASENETFVTSTDSVSYNYDSGDLDLSRYYEETINVLEKDGKQYLEFKGTGMANFIEALYVDGKKMAIKKNEDGSYIAQIGHEKSLIEKFNFTMIINAMGRIMSHSTEVEVVIPEEIIEIESGEKKPVSGNQTLKISNDNKEEKATIKTPENLPKNTEIQVELLDKDNDDVQTAIEKELEIAGTIVNVELDLDGGSLDNGSTFTLTLPFDAETYNEDKYKVDIYYFNTDTKEWEPQGADVNDRTGELTLDVKSFSTYGVFAKEKPEEGSDTEDPTDEEDETDNAKYSIDYIIKHATKDEDSVADGFFEKPGTLIEQDGKTYLEITVTGWSFIDDLSYNGKSVSVISEDTKEDTAVIQLEITGDLSDVIDLNMTITVPGIYENQEHDARLILDVDSKELIDEEDPTPNPDPTPEDPEKDETNGNGNGKGNGKGKGEGDDEKKSLTPEKAYEINYTILHEDGSGPSVADGFFRKPGVLLEYDGKTYFQMTVESAEMVKALSNEYGEYILVSKNDDGTMTIQLRVDNNLSDMKLDMHIVVPSGAIPGFPGYDEKHGAILTFDKDSMKEISVEGLEVAASGDKNNENGPYDENATPGKPSLGDNDEKNGGKKGGDNPQTGDTSQIFFFSMLLAASLGVLALQIRRRLTA